MTAASDSINCTDNDARREAWLADLLAKAPQISPDRMSRLVALLRPVAAVDHTVAGHAVNPTAAD